MAKFSELKKLVGSGKVKPVRHFDIDSFAEHLPREVSRANDEFVKDNIGIPGVLDFDERGFTEPEDERDCYANNLALSYIDDIMPYLEKMNKHMTTEEIESPDYSMHTLHLAAECYQAKINGLSDEKIDFMIDNKFEGDKQYFGCKHYEYGMCQCRRDFESGMSIEDEKIMLSITDQARQSVDFYIEKKGFDVDVIKVLGQARNQGLAYGLYSHLTYDGDDSFSLKDAEMIMNCVHRIDDYAKKPGNNVKSKRGEFMYPRFSVFAMEGYVDDYVQLMKDCGDKIADSGKLMMLTEDFLKNGNGAWISDYAKNNPNSVDMCIRGMGDEKVMLFYANSTGQNSATYSEVNEFAKKNGMLVAFGTESSGFNGDTHIMYNPATYMDSDLPQWMIDYIKNEHVKAKTDSNKQRDTYDICKDINQHSDEKTSDLSL